MSPAGSGRARFDRGPNARVGRRAGRTSWRWLVGAWLTGVGLIVISGALPSVAGYLVILGACVLVGAVLGAHGGEPSGLRDHRQ